MSEIYLEQAIEPGGELLASGEWYKLADVVNCTKIELSLYHRTFARDWWGDITHIYDSPYTGEIEYLVLSVDSAKRSTAQTTYGIPDVQTVSLGSAHVIFFKWRDIDGASRIEYHGYIEGNWIHVRDIYITDRTVTPPEPEDPPDPTWEGAVPIKGRYRWFMFAFTRGNEHIEEPPEPESDIGKYIAVGYYSEGTQFLSLLSHDNGEVSEVGGYITPGAVMALDFSPDGNYLAAGHKWSPFLTLLSRSGADLTLSDTYTLPFDGISVRFSHSGAYLAAGSTDSPYFILLNHSDGELSFSDDYRLPARCRGISFSPDDKYIVTVHTTSPGLTLLLHTDGNLSKATEFILPGTGYSVDFSSDGNYVVAGSYGTHNVTLLSHSDGVLAKVSGYTAMGGNAVDAVAFSPDGKYIAVSGRNYPYFELLENVEGTLIKVDDYAFPDTVQGIRFSPDGNFIAVAHFGSPYFTLLSHSNGEVALADTCTLNSTGGTSVAFY